MLHLSNDRFSPVGGYLHIVIEQYIIVSFDLGKRTVVAFGKAVILVHLNDTQGGVVFL